MHSEGEPSNRHNVALLKFELALPVLVLSYLPPVIHTLLCEMAASPRPSLPPEFDGSGSIIHALPFH